MIIMGHGAGGKLSQDLVAEHFLPHFSNSSLSEMLDSGCVGDLALTTDAYVVTPRFFPGGDLGRLAVCGTVNDLCMVGATPLGLSAAFILEEGLQFAELDRLVASMAQAAKQADVSIIAGDTKVVPRGACDAIFITTAGFGKIDASFRPTPQQASPGDVVIVSGTIADHGMAVMACREGLRLKGDLRSDAAPLRHLVDKLKQAHIQVHTLRDPTRGGVAQSLLEIANAAQCHIVLDETKVPVRPEVRAACELLGLDPLYVANEGKFLACVPADHADRCLELLREDSLGANATVIGHIEAGRPGCEVRTALGARRSLRMASGELLPRIC